MAKNKSKPSKFKRFVFWAGLTLAIWLTIIVIVFVGYCSVDLPDVKPLLVSKEATIELKYENGKTLKSFGAGPDEITNYAEFPLYLIDALLATEDRKFFKHGGFDYLAILRAMAVNISAGAFKQGGSTITQQLAKTLLQNRSKTLKRKVQELLLSIQLERRLTKEEILMLYFNKSYFGAGRYGIKSASQFYFNKSVADLTLPESAMLVGILKAPSKYSPQNNPELSAKRMQQVIRNMQSAGIILDMEHDYEGIASNAADSTDRPDTYLYFADWVRSQLAEHTDKQNVVVQTTLDFAVQETIEKAIENAKPKMQVAIIVLSKDGAVLGMAGGKNYHVSEFNRAVYGSRQAGSAFKLFVYLAGMIQKGFSPQTRFKDERVAVGTWFPENLEEKYYGVVSMRDGFAKSLNSIAIQVSEAAGLLQVARIAKKMGIVSPIDHHDPTIALGTTQVSPLELTVAYSVVVNGGFAVLPYSITEIKERGGNVIYKRKTHGLNRILPVDVVEQMRDMLRAVVEEGTGRRAFISGINMGGKLAQPKTEQMDGLLAMQEIR